MKKVLIVLLALVFVFGLATMSFAAESKTKTDSKTSTKASDTKSKDTKADTKSKDGGAKKLPKTATPLPMLLTAGATLAAVGGTGLLRLRNKKEE